MWFFFLILSVRFVAQGQNKSEFKYNEFRLIIGTALTKTNFDEGAKQYYLPFSTGMPLSRPIWGNNFALEYTRFLNPKIGITVRFAQTEKGQQTEKFFFNRQNMKIDSLDFDRISGGLSFQIHYLSNEFSLLYRQTIFDAYSFKLSLFSGLSLDYTNSLVLRDYILEGEKGFNGFGCCATYFYNSTGTCFQRLMESIKQDHFRIGILVSPNIEFKINSRMNTFFQPELEFLTDYIKKDKVIKADFLLSGTIQLIRFQTGFGFKF